MDNHRCPIDEYLCHYPIGKSHWLGMIGYDCNLRWVPRLSLWADILKGRMNVVTPCFAILAMVGVLLCFANRADGEKRSIWIRLLGFVLIRWDLLSCTHPIDMSQGWCW